MCVVCVCVVCGEIEDRETEGFKIEKHKQKRKGAMENKT